MKRAKICVWLILAVLLIVSVVRSLTFGMFKVDLLIHWTFRIISFSACICIFWAVAGIFSKKTKTKVISVIAMVLFCVSVYAITHYQPKVVQMKEDVLYIKPKQ